jgi:hypothetical protein
MLLEYESCDANVSVCDVQSVDRALQDHLICEDGEKKKNKKKGKEKINKRGGGRAY